MVNSLEIRGTLLKRITKKVVGQRGELLNFLGPLMKVGLPLINKVLTPLAKSALVPFGLTTVVSATNAALQKEIFDSGLSSDLAKWTTLWFLTKKWMILWK